MFQRLRISALVFLLAGATLPAMAQGVKIGDNPATLTPSAVLEANSTTQGFLPPRMMQAQIKAIASPVAGLMVYCTDCAPACLKIYDVTSWLSVAGPYFACGSGANTFTQTVLTSSSSHSGTYTLPYTAGNGSSSYGSVTLTQNGIAMTRAAGTYASGGGNVVYTFGGTHSGTNKTETFTLAEGCTVSVGCQNNIGTTGGAIVQMLYDNDGYGVNGAAVTPNYGWCAREVSVTTTTPAGTQVWLDRNLGADGVATSSTDNTSYGSFYQWGRRADGHQRESSTSRGIDVGTSAPNATLATTDQPTNGDFITANSGNYDWRSLKNDNLWLGVSGVNNPCPSGFRLPTQSEFQALASGWSGNYMQTSATNTSSMGPIKMPLAGYRSYSTGALGNVGSSAYYWSSTVSGSIASYFTFVSGSLSPANANNRAFGFTVRCIKN